MSEKPVFVVAQLSIEDPEKFAEYRDQAIPLLERFGGRVIGISAGPPEVVEGTWRPQVLVIQQWPTKDAFHRFYACDEYKPVLPLRLESTATELVIFDSAV